MPDINIDIKIDADINNLNKREHKGLVNGLALIAADVAKKTRALPFGESFVDRTGGLRASILPEKTSGTKLESKVTVHKEYGGYVNDGTQRIRPRRFLEKGLKNAEPNFEKIIKLELDRSM